MLTNTLHSHKIFHLWCSRHVTKNYDIIYPHFRDSQGGTEKLSVFTSLGFLNHNFKTSQGYQIMGITALTQLLLPANNPTLKLIMWGTILSPECCFNSIVQKHFRDDLYLYCHKFRDTVEIHVTELQSYWSISSLILRLNFTISSWQYYHKR